MLSVGLQCTLVLMAAMSEAGRHTSVGPNVAVSKCRASHSHFEVVIAAHPSDPNRLLAGAMKQAGRGDGIDVVAYHSSDGGVTWELAFENPNPEPGAFGKPAKSDSWADPAVVYGPDGSPYYAAIYMGSAENNPPQLVTVRSLDGGKTWEASKVTADFPDRPFLAVDCTHGKNRGRVYCNWANPDPDTRRRGLAISISRNAGKTFGPLRVWSIKQTSVKFTMTPGPAVVLSNGTLVVPYCHREDSLVNEPVTVEICVRRSNTGGDSFSDEQSVTNTPYRRGWCSNMPLLAADPGSRSYKDRLYLAWSQATADGQRIFLCFSSDRGLTWSKPTILSDESVGKNYDAVLPAVAVSQKGIVAVTWYDSRPGQDGKPCMNVRFRASVDGGTSWLPSACVTDVPSQISFQVSTPLFAVPPDHLGDTAGLAADALGSFHPLWVDKRSGVRQVYTAKVSVRDVAGGK
jgi:hypothetical protein